LKAELNRLLPDSKVAEITLEDVCERFQATFDMKKRGASDVQVFRNVTEFLTENHGDLAIGLLAVPNSGNRSLEIDHIPFRLANWSSFDPP
jgi:hypothetical protein